MPSSFAPWYLPRTVVPFRITAAAPQNSVEEVSESDFNIWNLLQLTCRRER